MSKYSYSLDLGKDLDKENQPDISVKPIDEGRLDELEKDSSEKDVNDILSNAKSPSSKQSTFWGRTQVFWFC